MPQGRAWVGVQNARRSRSKAKSSSSSDVSSASKILRSEYSIRERALLRLTEYDEVQITKGSQIEQSTWALVHLPALQRRAEALAFCTKPPVRSRFCRIEGGRGRKHPQRKYVVRAGVYMRGRSSLLCMWLLVRCVWSLLHTQNRILTPAKENSQTI